MTDGLSESIISNVKLSNKEFVRLSEFIQRELGIKMPEAKKTLLESRLQKRLRFHGMRSYCDYCDYLFSPEGLEEELVYMFDLVTTNKTDFFREPDHFDYLFSTVLPEMMRTEGAGVKRPLMIWSAGCSTGEEPYTMAMVLSEFAAKHKPACFRFQILATDISTRVLEIAAKGVYAEERIEPIPLEMRRKYLLRSKDKEKGVVKMSPELRSVMKFRRVNFMEGDFGFRERMDIIFCRNVLIYFDKDTQETLLRRFCGHIVPGGYIFVGHSESLGGLDLPMTRVAPAVYRVVE